MNNVRQEVSLYQQLIDAGASCGEAAGILDIPYLRAAHQRRQRIIEAAGSATLDGRPTTTERLFAWLGDIPIVAQANLGAEGYAADLFRLLIKQDLSDPFGIEVRDLADAARAKAGRDPLLAAAFLFRGQDAVTQASRAAYFLFLRGALGAAEPAMSPSFNGLAAAARRPSAEFDRYIADRLARAGRRALANAKALRFGLAAAYSVLGTARSSSRVHAIAELLFAGHPLSIARASRLFHISRLAARTHLVRLERDGIAERATRSKTGVIYVARDGLMTFGQVTPAPPPKDSSRLVVNAGKPLSADERARLEAASDDVAARMQELDSLLQRLNPSN